MIECPYCGFANPADEDGCLQCGQPLHLAIPPANATRRLDAGVESVHFPHWGTARLGQERKLVLHVRDYQTPLVMHLTDQLTLGRHDPDTGEDPDVNLEEYDAQEKGVSRRHAAILVEDDALKVMDLGSANATYLNGQKLIAHQARILRDGDELRLARLVIRVHFA